MKTDRLVVHTNNYDYAEQVLDICFDSNSIEKFSSGLKLIYSNDDPPVFVKIEKGRSEFSTGVYPMY